MSSTTFLEGNATRTWGGHAETCCSDELLGSYQQIVREQRLSWTEHHRLKSLLGSGGQGVVYLSERRGTDNFTLPVALKIFSPERYEDERSYDDAMGRMAQVAARVAQIQQDNLLDVHNWVDRSRIRMMEMEWVDGYDLSRLLTRKMLERLETRVSSQALELHQPGDRHGRADAAAVEAGHRHRHRPRLPGRAWPRCTAKASCTATSSRRTSCSSGPATRRSSTSARPSSWNGCRPGGPARRAYAAPEVLEGAESTPRSDLASLGYVLVEMLSGSPPFAGLTNFRDLLEAKRFMAQRLPQILPSEVGCNELLMNFCRGLIAPDPMRRFPSAEAADLVKEGAASFHRQLIKGDLASEYDNEIRLWLEELPELE